MTPRQTLRCSAHYFRLPTGVAVSILTLSACTPNLNLPPDSASITSGDSGSSLTSSTGSSPSPSPSATSALSDSSGPSPTSTPSASSTSVASTPSPTASASPSPSPTPTVSTVSLSFAAVSGSPNVGTPFSVTVRALTGSGALDPTYSRTITLTSNDAGATLPAAHTFVPVDGGTYTFSGYNPANPGLHTITANDGTLTATSSAITVGTAASLCSITRTAYSYTGSDQSLVVPSGCTSLYFVTWGAGGGGGGGGAYSGNVGGAGGFARGRIQVTPGETLTLVVGQGGRAPSSNVGGAASYGGGGSGASGWGGRLGGGSGGGYSGVFRGAVSQGNALLIAGGGGGSNIMYDTTATMPGSAGGGLRGQEPRNFGICWNNINVVGTQTAGGTPAAVITGNTATALGTAGSALQGGAGNYAEWGGGGGGGGYFGGAGGGSDGGYANCNYGAPGAYGTGGGGGSGYIKSSGITESSTLPGTSDTPPLSSDPDRGTAGSGGASKAAGGSGTIIVYGTSSRILSVSPNNGIPTWSGTIQITGLNFEVGSTATVGGAACTNVSFISSSELRCTAPTGALGAATVAVTSPRTSSSVTLAGAYTYRNCGSGNHCESFSNVLASQFFSVPFGVTALGVKAWGAGGGGGGGNPGSGGGGGYSTGTLAVTPGQLLTVAAGQGGGSYFQGIAWVEGGGWRVWGFGGGGPGGTGSGTGGVGAGITGGGAGGGLSGVFSGLMRQANALLIAGGGGGGAGSTVTGANWYQGIGGAGGDTFGASPDSFGSCWNVPTGGTQGAAGAAASVGTGSNSPTNRAVGGPGGRSYLYVSAVYDNLFGGYGGGFGFDLASWNGTVPVYGGGGGGGGYFGGGGGGGDKGSGSPCTGYGGIAGAGGSGYIGGTGVTSASMSAGSGTTPGNASDSDRNGAGTGAAASAAGADGRVVLYWQ